MKLLTHALARPDLLHSKPEELRRLGPPFLGEFDLGVSIVTMTVQYHYLTLPNAVVRLAKKALT